MLFNAKTFAAVLLCLAFSGPSAAAQAPGAGESLGSASFSVFTLKDGLVNASVSSMVQDSKGFIWMGTQGGLVRYDGSGFKTWQNQPFDTNTLSTDLVQTLFRDRDDILWVGTYNGLDRYDPATGRFTLYKNEGGDEASLSNNLVIAVARDDRGRLWVGTANGLNRLDEKTGSFVRYFNRPGDPRSLPHNTVRALFCDSKGRFWVGTAGGGFARYDPERDDFDVLAGSPERGGKEGALPGGPPPSLALQTIAQDAEGYLWLGEWGTGLVRYDPDRGLSKTYGLPDLRIYAVNTDDPGTVRVGTWGGGLFILDKGSGRVEAYRHSRALGALPHDVVYSLLTDASGQLWVGTNGGGVARMDRSHEAYSTLTANPDDPLALPSGKILSILVDSRKELWVSVYAGGLNLYDERLGGWRHFRHDPKDPGGLADDTVVCLYEDREGNLWAGTNSGLCLYDRTAGRFRRVPRFGGIDSPDADIVYAMTEDRRESGVYWIGTYTKGLYRWDRAKGAWANWRHDPKDPDSLSDNLVNSLAWDAGGELWIGTNNGLNHYAEGRFLQFYYDPAKPKGLSSSAIIAIFIDSRGEFWLATRSGGLDRYEPSTNSFEHFTRQDGLPSNDVYNIIEDSRGDLWVVSQTGLARRDRLTGAIKTVTLGNNLDQSSYNQGAFAAPDGKLYFGSVGVLTVFDPRRYHANTHMPPVFVTDFSAANRPKLAEPSSSTTGIHLESWENSVEFRFAALDYINPEQNLFAWKLEGFDKAWTFSSTRRFVSYTNLPGGSYVFRVRAANNDGVWNEEGASVAFRVANPAWKSPAAFALYLLLIALVGYGLATLRSNRLLAAKVRELTQARGELELASAEARRLAARAEEATKAKSDFIAMVSHEVRNSLNGIVGVAELLSRDRLKPKQEEEVEVIRQSGNLLLALVNDILDLSKAETDRIELEDLPWSPRELAARLRALHEAEARERGIRLRVELGEGLPETVGGDPTRIQQIVENLLSNALRFTEAGEVGVEFALIEREGGEAPLLGLRISDTGLGIGPEKLATIFEPFRQADPSISRRYGGTGLGLSIVKRLVGLMGGDISVDSSLGRGSTFEVRLPLLPAPRPLEERAPPQPGSAAGLRVLVVDDDPVNRRVAADLVAWLGGEAVTAESGAQALEHLKTGAWDAVLLDEHMPGMDGFETARRIRATEAEGALRRVPVFSMTARLEGDLRGRCEDVGMDGYLAKPLTLESLGNLLGRLLPKVERGGAQPLPPEPAPGPAPRGFNRPYFEERYPRGDSLGYEILELWLANTAVLFDRALEAGREGDFLGLRNHIHRLAGSTSIITEGGLVEELRGIERSIIQGGDEGPIGPALARVEALAPDFTALVAEIRAYFELLGAEGAAPEGGEA